jgi:hypothetical protein
MSFPKMGKFFPDHCGAGACPDSCFAAEIAAALHRELGSTHAGIKTAAAWTGANERTTKNWFSGRYGPSGEHLVGLARNSNEVLATFLTMTGHKDLIAAAALSDAETHLTALLDLIRTMRGTSA